MKHHPSPALVARFRSYSWLLVAVWTGCVGGSLAWNLYHEERHSLDMVRNTAQVVFENDILYRRWSAVRGGVYVRASAETPPNPYLHVPDRDVTTTSGLSLTLVNPAYMARQVSELAGVGSASRGHITSLDPIRPENAADEWETAALQAFEQGASEVSSVEQTEGGAALRLMRPFLVERPCLKCHAAQGYREGDVRGGVSVSVPLEPVWTLQHTMTVNLILAHLGLWGVGVTGIVVSKRGLAREILAREQAEAAVEAERKLLRTVIDLIPDFIYVKDRDSRFLVANRATANYLGFAEVGPLLGRTDGDIFPPQVAAEFRADEERVLAGQPLRNKEEVIDCLDGRRRVALTTKVPWTDGRGQITALVGTGHDITDRREAQREREIAVEFLAMINRTFGLRPLIQAAVEFFHQQSGCEAIGARLQEGEDYPYYETRGFPAEFLQTRSSFCRRDADGQIQRDAAGTPVVGCMCGAVIYGRCDRGVPCFTAAGAFWTNSTTELLARTPGADLCHGAGYESLALIPLCAGNQRLGLLHLCDRCPGRFTAELVASWERLAGHLAVAIAKAQAEERLKTSLGEKEVLLKEIHHRVKNNMQVISSLMSLQADVQTDPALRGTLGDVRDRVRSMALVHERLYQSANLAEVEFAEYTRNLLRYLWRAHGRAAAGIELQLDLHPVWLLVDQAVPLGLILNELVSNTLKHAFPGGKGRVRVALGEDDAERIALRVDDDGTGLPEGSDWRASRSLGLRLVLMLVTQLKGQAEASRAVGGGTQFHIAFPRKRA